MTNIESICSMLGITKKTWYNWKREERPITKFIEKYLTYDDILEFLDEERINKYDFFLNIERDFIQEYIEFYEPENYNFNPIPFLQKKYYWDFIFRFKHDILNINDKMPKTQFLSLLFEYQIILINIANKINYPLINVTKDFNHLFEKFNNIDEIFIKFLIHLIKHNFIQINKYKLSGALFPIENKTFITPYDEKTLFEIPIEKLKALNEFETYQDKDFFVVYEDFLHKLQNKESFTEDDLLILQELENNSDLD